MSEPTVTIPLSDYKRLLESAECDEMIVWCEVCGAWLDLNESARAAVEDFSGCWKVASDRKQDQSLCKSYRAHVMEGLSATPART